MWLTFSPLFCFSSFLHISQYRLLYHQSVYCIRKRNSIHLADTYLMTEKRKRNKLKKKNTSTIINSILYSPFFTNYSVCIYLLFVLLIIGPLVFFLLFSNLSSIHTITCSLQIQIQIQIQILLLLIRNL